MKKAGEGEPRRVPRAGHVSQTAWQRKAGPGATRSPEPFPASAEGLRQFRSYWKARSPKPLLLGTNAPSWRPGARRPHGRASPPAGAAPREPQPPGGGGRGPSIPREIEAAFMGDLQAGGRRRFIKGRRFGYICSHPTFWRGMPRFQRGETAAEESQSHTQTADPAGTMTGACPANPSCFLFSGPAPPARSCLGELESGSRMEICP
ncbi:uncharacterized protein LOC129558177 [Moschus berezovskii]|uniref:uncharacterized protein LOC129558177 n=1 Tax=Moschus berezovskii TaxID=68408 RepID=UPI002443A87C|nr:uncharacterized protein LOC129558177 [Moschus berezovskii]